jgi:DNA primase
VKDIDKLRKIPIINILRKLSIDAVEKKKDQFWFRPQWREERTASAKCENNLFYDFGEGYGGNAVDYVMKHFAIDFMQAVKWLRNEEITFSFDPPKKSELINAKKKNTYCIKSVQPLKNQILVDYLKSRKMNIDVCKKYLFQVFYTVTNKDYFAVGFKNDKGHFEIRNKYAKLALGTKWFSWINKCNSSIIVLESWSDFISLLTLYPKYELSKDFLILNSLSMLSKTDEVLLNYSEIFWALDNDAAGSKATENCLEKWNNELVVSKDVRCLFQGSKDLNEYLVTKETTLG